jgi:hypothetical protein
MTIMTCKETRELVNLAEKTLNETRETLHVMKVKCKALDENDPRKKTLCTATEQMKGINDKMSGLVGGYLEKFKDLGCVKSEKKR